VLTIDNVIHGLANFCFIKSIGPDGIPGDYLFKLHDEIAYSLTLLFNKSLNSGVFPSVLKFGSITPILKSGIVSNVCNYRPITVLPHLSELFETFSHPPLNYITVKNQHGFRPSYSTTTCNVVLTNYIFDAFCQQNLLDVIHMDFVKAYDRVNHLLLINTLYMLGIGEPLLSWFCFYLVHRKLQVIINGHPFNLSTPISVVTCATRQYSFALTIFSIY